LAICFNLVEVHSILKQSRKRNTAFYILLKVSFNTEGVHKSSKQAGTTCCYVY